MQRERVMRSRDIVTERTAASLMLSFKEVNKIYAKADIEFRLNNTTTSSAEAPNGAEALDDPGFLMLARGFPMKDTVNLLLVRRFAGAEGGASVEKLGVCAVGDGIPTTPSPTSLGTCSDLPIKATSAI